MSEPRHARTDETLRPAVSVPIATRSGEAWPGVTLTAAFLASEATDRLPHASSSDHDGVEVEPAARRLLIVEDDENVRWLLSKVLADAGYEVDVAGDGLQGWESIKGATGAGRPYHLVVSDVVMPEMDGIELAGRIASAFPDVSVILMSGYTQGPLPENIVFMKKPFTGQEMVSRVKDVLSS